MLSTLRQIVKDLDLAAYANYRTFLGSIYELMKGSGSYSYALFSADLGLSSTNAHSIICGKRDLSEKLALRIATRLELTSVQRRALVAMVRQEHSKDKHTRDRAFSERLELAHKQVTTSNEAKILEFFEHWYHAAILEILRLPGAKSDPKWLSAILSPTVSLPKVKQSLRLFIDLKYLSEDKNGVLKPTQALITTGEEAKYLAVQSYHRQMLGLAVDAMDQVAAAERQITAITVAVSETLKEQMMEEMQALRKRFLHMAEQEKHQTKVIQINMQLFPLMLEDKKHES